MSKANRTKKTSVLIVITLLLPQLWQPEITFVIRVVSRKKKWKKKRKERNYLCQNFLPSGSSLVTMKRCSDIFPVCNKKRRAPT
jgi:hypothetical protein